MNDEVNGTKSLSLSGLAYSTNYTVWVNVTDPDGSGLYTRMWYVFTTEENSYPLFGAPSPSNGSSGEPLSLSWSIPISDPEGDSIDWTIQCNNGQASAVNGASNGTKSLSLSGLLHSPMYKIWVNATDPGGSGLFTRSWYLFTTATDSPPLFGVPSPGNGSAGNPLSFVWSILVNDTEGDDFNWTINCSDGQTNSTTAATNGTKTLSLIGLSYSTTYTVWVNATDPTGSGLYTRKWYTFTTNSIGGGGDGAGGYVTNDFSLPVSKPGGPYHGAVNTVIYFDGSASYDTDTSIVRYDWRFSSSDAWHNNSGAAPTHTYDVAGTFTVTLRVLDGGGNTGMNSTIAIISVEAVNQPPTAPRVTGPTIGVKNTPYIFSFVSADSDGDSIRYHVDWGDGSMNTSSLQNSSSDYTVAHTWTANNVYTIRVYAEDQNNASSESTLISMAINSTAVQGYGFCIDTNGDGFPDSFYWNSTGQITSMARQSNGTYLLDFNGDAAWDHWYNPVTNTISAYSPVLPVSQHQQSGDSWLFLAVIALVVVIIGLVVWLYRSGRI